MTKIQARDLKIGDKINFVKLPGTTEKVTIICSKVLFLNDNFIEVAFLDANSQKLVFEGLYSRDTYLEILS